MSAEPSDSPYSLLLWHLTQDQWHREDYVIAILSTVGNKTQYMSNEWHPETEQKPVNIFEILFCNLNDEFIYHVRQYLIRLFRLYLQFCKSLQAK